MEGQCKPKGFPAGERWSIPTQTWLRGDIIMRAYLVKIPVARKQLDRQANRQAEGIEAQGHNTEIMGAQPTGTIELSQNKRFYMRASLDTTYIDRDMQRLIKEVVVHLTSVEGTDVEVHLEVKAQALDGFSRQIARTVSENCRTLHIKDFGFMD